MAPQAADTAYKTKAVLIMSIWCTSYAGASILIRCGGRWRRTDRIWVEDVIILLSMLVLVARMVLVHFVLEYGTNNIDALLLEGDDDVRRRINGSQLVLVCRLLYLTFLWMIKLSVGIYIARLTNQFWASKSVTSNTSSGRAFNAFLSRYLNQAFYAFLILSYIVVAVSEAVECRPFSHYWQVAPTPSFSCRVAPGNFVTMGVFDIFTDLMLVVLPLPMIFSAKLPAKTKIETLLLMLFPLVNIGFTCYRLPFIFARDGAQPYRTLMASIDILISTSSANSLVVISIIKNRGFKKPKYRHPEEEGDDGALEHVSSSGIELGCMENVSPSRRTSGPFSKRTSYYLQSPRERRPVWGSDEELMHDDSDGGPFITRTISARDAGTVSSSARGLGVIFSMSNSTSHLSPDMRAETNIVATRSLDFDGRLEDGTGLSSPPPARSRTSLHQGIVVETSWHVGVSSM